MGVDRHQCSGLILAGGQSRRMGQCKALLSTGEKSFLEHLTEEMRFLPQVYLSANRPDLTQSFPGVCLPDVYQDCGPLAGVHSGLREMTTPYLLTVPCDMPGVSREVLELLLSQVPPQAEAMVCVDGTGKVHPLLGIYSKTLLSQLESYLEQGGRSARGFLDSIACHYLDVGQQVAPGVLTNLNTPQEYQHWLEEKK